MNSETQAALLWLAGVGGAIVIAATLFAAYGFLQERLGGLATFTAIGAAIVLFGIVLVGKKAPQDSGENA